VKLDSGSSSQVTVTARAPRSISARRPGRCERGSRGGRRCVNTIDIAAGSSGGSVNAVAGSKPAVRERGDDDQRERRLDDGGDRAGGVSRPNATAAARWCSTMMAATSSTPAPRLSS